jgi:hypothetical protein
LDSSIATYAGGWNQVRFGPAGAAGEDGLDAITLSVVPDTIALACNSTGVVNAGQLPWAVTYSVTQGANDITAVVSPSVVTSQCDVAYQGAGRYNVTAVYGDAAYFDLTVLKSGEGSAKKRVSISKVKAGNGATSTTDTSIGVNDTTTYGSANGGPITLSLGTGGTIYLSVVHEYTSTSTGRMAGKFQYRTTPGSGGWVDVAAEHVDPYVAAPGEPSYMEYTDSLAGPGSPTSWEFQYVNRRAQFTNIGHSYGQFTAEWQT